MTSQSPPRQQIALSHESPVRVKSVHSNPSYQNDILEDARLAVLEDLGPCIPEIPFQTFMDHLAPPQPDFDIDGTMKWLKGPAAVLTTSDRWTKFEKAPKDQESEDGAFGPISEIFTKVVEAIIANSQAKLTERDRSTDYLQNPNRAPTSTERHNASRPDGFLLLKDRNQGALSWADVAVSCEYKRKDGDDELDDDVRKCLWSLQHVMRDDLRRRATFGMTIENSTTRVWFCCRSSVVVSEPFDFIAEPKQFIKLLAAFAFADKKSLGFDPTIQPANDDEKQFIITVHPNNDKKNPRMFRTRKVISSYGAELLRGRGTRVFEAIEIDQNGSLKGSPVVLKDIWIDRDRTREGAILAQLHAAANGEDKELIKKHFLTTICHGDVWTEFDTLDDTENALMRGLNITTKHMFQLQRKQMIQKYPPASGSEGLRAISRIQAPHSHLRYAHKTHYRIVFKEKGITIDCIKSLFDVMTVLIETVRALQLLRKLGWVHRDVSVGNILSCDGVAKLADLEYAKNIGDVTSHEMRTGTMHFMSIEVATQRYLFRAPPPRASTSEMVQRAGTTQNVTPLAAPFSHNHLHDLESLWWVAVYVVFYNYFWKVPLLDDHPLFKLTDVEKQLKLAQFLFPPVPKSVDRRDGFQTLFLDACVGLPSNKKIICDHLDSVREILVEHYKIVESALPWSIKLNSSKDDIYEDFTTLFSASRDASCDTLLEFIPNIYTMLKKEKRPRSESTNDTGVAQKTPRRK